MRPVEIIRKEFSDLGLSEFEVVARHQNKYRAYVVTGPVLVVDGEKKKPAVAVTMTMGEWGSAKLAREALIASRARNAAYSMHKMLKDAS